MHESTLHQRSSFITLTYDDEHLPVSGSLNVKHWQLFAKRLRKNVGPFRFFHCGEYGDLRGRPHYHACIFGHDFAHDRQLTDDSRGYRLYTSDTLTNTWGKGIQCIIGELTYDSAAYVARYCLKKINGRQKNKTDPASGLKHYERCNSITGEITELKPEYTTMSRRPGLGSAWLKKWMTDVYPRDFVIGNGHKQTVPKFYDALYEIDHTKQLEAIKEKRIEKSERYANDNTPIRLAQRAKVAQGKIDLYKRNHTE